MRRSAFIVRILIISAVLVGYALTGIAAAFSWEPLTPLTCPPPAAPSSFWGYVTLNGAPAPIGLKVAAWIGGVEVASTTTQAMNGATYYLLDVPDRAVDPATGEVCRQGGAAGEIITFVLCNYVTASETGIWNGGTQVRQDLTGSGSCAPVTTLYDWGDLPDPPYATLASQDGPRHALGAGLMLGETVDDELDGKPNSSATGDSDDGVVFLSAPNAPHGGWLDGHAAEGNGCWYRVTLSGGSGVLQLWMDFGSELAPVPVLDAAGAPVPGGLLGPGVHTVACDVPAGTFEGGAARAIAARFRLSSAGGLGATGLASDGEVEDYVFHFGPNVVGLRNLRALPAQEAGLALIVGGILLMLGSFVTARHRL